MANVDPVYDARNLVTEEDSALEGYVFYEYDLAQRLKTRYSASQATYFKHDQRNQIKEIRFQGVAGDTHSFHYNGLGERVVMIGGIGGTTPTYLAYNGPLLTDRDASGTTYGAYRWGPQGDLIESTDIESGVSAGPAVDQRGSVNALPGAAGGLLYDLYREYLSETLASGARTRFLPPGQLRLDTPVQMNLLPQGLYLVRQGVLSVGASQGWQRALQRGLASGTRLAPVPAPLLAPSGALGRLLFYRQDDGDPPRLPPPRPEPKPPVMEPPLRNWGSLPQPETGARCCLVSFEHPTGNLVYHTAREEGKKKARFVSGLDSENPGFKIKATFLNDPTKNCHCQCCQYRQYVKGKHSFIIGGVETEEEGPAKDVTAEGRPVKSDFNPNTFVEDLRADQGKGRHGKPLGLGRKYSLSQEDLEQRSEALGEYSLDECTFTASDAPRSGAYSYGPGCRTKLTIDVSFEGRIYDICAGGAKSPLADQNPTNDGKAPLAKPMPDARAGTTNPGVWTWKHDIDLGSL